MAYLFGIDKPTNLLSLVLPLLFQGKKKREDLDLLEGKDIYLLSQALPILPLISPVETDLSPKEKEIKTAFE